MAYWNRKPRPATCPRRGLCPLHGRMVPADGALDGRTLLVGEAPGLDEDVLGIPFVGKSGDELDRYALSAGIPRATLAITNLVKCRPPDNRDPTAEEVRWCTGQWLVDELLEAHPRVIGAIGRLSAQWFLGPLDMEQVHGIPQHWSALGFPAVVVPCYHPAAGLHNPNLMLHIRSDFEALAAVVHRRLEPRPIPRSTGNYRLLTGDEVKEVLACTL